MLANFWQTFPMLASYVANYLKHAGSLTTSTLSAGWESDSFKIKILLAGGEDRVFFPRKIKY